jgi:hypothetical protein
VSNIRSSSLLPESLKTNYPVHEAHYFLGRKLFLNLPCILLKVQYMLFSTALKEV